MRLTHFFIDHPRFATVLSIFVTLFGLGALTILPVAQYPEIVPPTVQITTVYPGASAETVARERSTDGSDTTVVPAVLAAAGARPVYAPPQANPWLLRAVSRLSISARARTGAG